MSNIVINIEGELLKVMNLRAMKTKLSLEELIIGLLEKKFLDKNQRKSENINNLAEFIVKSFEEVAQQKSVFSVEKLLGLLQQQNSLEQEFNLLETRLLQELISSLAKPSTGKAKFVQFKRR